MEVSRRKSAPRSVVAGSVWESRMKMDEVKGGIKVFNGEETHKEESNNGDGGSDLIPPINNTLEPKQSSVVREKRRTWKPQPIEVIGGGSPIQSRKIRLEPNKFSSKSCKDFSVSIDEIEKNPIQIKHSRSVSHKDLNKSCNEFGVCKEKTISSSLGNARLDSNDHDEDGEEKEEDKEKKVIEKKSFDVKEVDVFEQKPKKVVNEEKKVNQIYKKSIPISPNVKKQQPLLNDHPSIDQDVKKPPPIIHAEESERFPEVQNNFHNIVDLVMWKDAARSGFVFGLGSFILISFSYTDDLNLSLISAISYMGLVYLAAIFIYKSIICGGDIDVENSIHLVGEEEAIWLLKLVLPYLNEILFKLKAIFSGDPATTMKLAMLLFVLARCGSFITIGKMAKLGFVCAFTLPKVCSSYSAQLTAYGKFWIQNLRETWHSCPQKKAVAIVAFIFLWNFSSVLARIWAVFMLVVTVRYYQQSSPGEEHGPVEVQGDANTMQGGRRKRQGVWANRVNPVKEKKET